jgi:hypothetical protein
MELYFQKLLGEFMMDEFIKMLQKKKQEQKGPMDSNRMKAKASVAKELSDMLGEDITEDIKNMNKVTVASDSEEGLKRGLKKAEDVISSKMKDKMSEDEDSEYESEDMEEDSSSEDSSSEDSDIEDQIRELEDQIRDLKSKR